MVQCSLQQLITADTYDIQRFAEPVKYSLAP